MLKKKNMEWANKHWHHVVFVIVIAIGIVLGFLYEDMQPDDGENYIVNNHPMVLNDTVVVHDTVVKVITKVKWKYKKTCCCCFHQKCAFYGIEAQQDSLKNDER